MWGEPRVAAECTGKEREFGRCARPTVWPGRNVHDDRDDGDGSDTRPCGRRTSGSLTETRVRDWQDWPERFDGSADRHMNPGPLDGTGQRVRTVLAACVEPDGPVDADGDQARVIDDARHPASLASCRCRYRRPRTVCVVPRERWGGTGGVSRDRTRPGTGDPMSASGPPSVRW